MAESERANKPDADRSLFREADTVQAAGRLLAYGLFCGIVFPGVMPSDECPIGIPLTVARLRRILTGFRFPQRDKRPVILMHLVGAVKPRPESFSMSLPPIPPLKQRSNRPSSPSVGCGPSYPLRGIGRCIPDRR